MDTTAIGRAVVLAGAVVVAVGLAIWFGPRIPFFGRLPGDIVIERENYSVFAPLASMLILSLALTILFNVVGYFRR